MTRQDVTVTKYLPRLVLSWLVVGVLLVYGITQAIMATLPLFAS